jgi:hypothetical protein
LNNIAVMHMEAKKYTSAIHFQGRAVQLLERLLGSHHPHTMNVKGNLGITYLRSDDRLRGEPLLREALDFLTTQNYPSSHPWMKKFTQELQKFSNSTPSGVTTSGRFTSVGSSGMVSDSMSMSSSDSDAARSRLSNQQKKNNFMYNANASSERYAASINPGKIKRAPIKVSAPQLPSLNGGAGGGGGGGSLSKSYHRMNSDGEVIELNDVTLLPDSEDESDDDDELDLEQIIVDDFFLNEDGSVEKNTLPDRSKPSPGMTVTPRGAGTSAGSVRLSGNKTALSLPPASASASGGASVSSNSSSKKSPRNIPQLSTPLSGIGSPIASTAADGVDGAGSGNDSARSGRQRGTYRDNTTRIKAEKRLENLSKASNSRQINVNIVDKTTKTRRPIDSSGGSQSDSSTGPISPTNAIAHKVVRPKSHRMTSPREAGGETGGGVDSGDATGDSSDAPVSSLRR